MIWSDLLCCLSPIPTPSPVLPTQDDKIAASCVFCNPSPDRFDIILQDAHYLVFKDRSPAALRHLLVIPRDHVPNVKSLEGPQGATIVKGLELIGREALSKVIRQGEESNEFRFGFHVSLSSSLATRSGYKLIFTDIFDRFHHFGVSSICICTAWFFPSNRLLKQSNIE